MKQQIQFEWSNGRPVAARAEIRLYHPAEVVAREIPVKFEIEKFTPPASGHRLSDPEFYGFGVTNHAGHWLLPRRAVSAPTVRDCVALVEMVVRHGLLWNGQEYQIRPATIEELEGGEG